MTLFKKSQFLLFGLALSRQKISLGVIFLLLSFSAAPCRTEEPEDPGSCEDDCQGEDQTDDGIRLGKGAIAGLAISVVAVAVAVPMIICFCLGCCCFRHKEPKILVVTPSARKKNVLETPAPASAPHRLQIEEDESRRNSGISGPARAALTPTAPEYMHLDRNGRFFFNQNFRGPGFEPRLSGFEPPPPYVFSGADDARNSVDSAWAVKEVNIEEKVTESRLGPSLIKEPIA